MPEAQKLSYLDGSSREVHPNETEIAFPDGKLIVSTTDLDGKITHINKSFEDMSGYTKDELIGSPHHILRHPDMPAAAFADLWSTVKNGQKWHGYVKNLRKNGSYYWVYAAVIPNIRDNAIVGYTSVRRKPARSKIEEHIHLYANMLKKESA